MLDQASFTVEVDDSVEPGSTLPALANLLLSLAEREAEEADVEEKPDM